MFIVKLMLKLSEGDVGCMSVSLVEDVRDALKKVCHCVCSFLCKHCFDVHNDCLVRFPEKCFCSIFLHFPPLADGEFMAGWSGCQNPIQHPLSFVLIIITF